MSGRAKLLKLDVAILIAWVIGIRVHLGGWDWLTTRTGIVALGVQLAWDAWPSRDTRRERRNAHGPAAARAPDRKKC